MRPTSLGSKIRAALLCAGLASSLSAAHAAHDPLLDFLQKNRCAVADRLQRLFDAGDPAQDRDRFIAVTLPERGPQHGPQHGYVQCRFHDRETRMLCEASSGFYETKPGATRTHLAPAKIAALARLGFSTDDSKGNFSLDVAVPKPPDFDRTADLILRALYDGYGARDGDALKFTAPFAPGLTLACDPVG